jgi:hypothetical protein
MAKTKKKARSNDLRSGSFRVLADRIAKELDADLLFYNAPIERHLDQRVIELCNSMRRRTNVALFLITSGGDADAAYRIATCLQNKYKQFLLFVPGYCKSAGTLVALGAHQIVISDQGEHGPLDVQMQRKDELVGSESGLTSTTALRTLNEQAFLAFEYFLIRITQGAGPSISTKTVTDIAVKMTCGTFSHIYQQIDPMHVAEAERALQVARAYGYRLVGRSQNLVAAPNDALEHLITHYPSHGFILDQSEAKKIFKNVRDFSQDELALMKHLGPLGRWPVAREDDYRVTFISTEIAAKAGRSTKAKGSQNNAKQKKSGSEGKSRTGTGDAATATGTGPSVVAQIPAVQGITKRHV